MAAFIGLFLVFVLIQTVFLAVSVGIGFLLRWLIPGVDLGAGVLAGLISTIAICYFFLQALKLTSLIPTLGRPGEDDEDDEDCDEDDDEDEEDESPPARKRHFSPPPMIGQHWKKRNR